MTKCEKCGKKLGLMEAFRVEYPKNEQPKYYCLKCYEQVKLQKAENTIKEKEEIMKTKIMDKLSLPEAEFLAMIYELNKEQKEFLSDIKENVKNINTIMMIYFVLFLISLILTIVSVFAILR